MDVTIRSMEWDDLDAVLRLQAATPEISQWPRTVYESYLQHGSAKRLFVAVDGSRFAGFAAARTALDSCTLESIAVDVQARRCGVGKALLAVLIDWARERLTIRVELEVRSRSASAIEFYESAGFEKDGFRPGYYRDPEDDAVLMSLPL